jgi:hypothetical protein
MKKVISIQEMKKLIDNNKVKNIKEFKKYKEKIIELLKKEQKFMSPSSIAERINEKGNKSIFAVISYLTMKNILLRYYVEGKPYYGLSEWKVKNYAPSV